MSHSILVIGDNESNLKLAEKILTLSGYEVRAAVGGYIQKPISIQAFRDEVRRHLTTPAGEHPRP